MDPLSRKQRNLSTLECALQALKREIFDFEFAYPLETDEQAGPSDSLNYYIYSNRLLWRQMRMDADGVPRTWTRTTGTNYWPSYVAWYGLVELGSWLRTRAPEHLCAFRRQTNWLLRKAVFREDGCVVWTTDCDYQDCGIVLRRPWVSAHPQGLAMSALVREWRLEKSSRLEEILLRAPGVFDLAVERGGVRVRVGRSCLYSEVPGGPEPGILDGFMTSLLGLYDVHRATGHSLPERLFAAGVEGLERVLPFWDYRGKWSWYGHRERLCPPQYHVLNRVLLESLGRLTGISTFLEYSRRWNPENLSRRDRAEIHLVCVATQMYSRMRRRTRTHKTVTQEPGSSPGEHARAAER